MALIDGRGRLFGRVNLIDAGVGVLVLVLIPLAYASYRIFRTPTPQIAAIEPEKQTWQATGLRVRVHGENFRPYLRAFVSKNGDPFSLLGRDPRTTQAIFMVETPTVVELKLPDIPAGTYDLYLFDEAQQVASRPEAFTIALPEQDVTVKALVRFVVPPEMVPLVKEGDVDRFRPESNVAAATQNATLTAVHVRQDRANRLDLQLTPGGKAWVGALEPGTTLDAELRVPVIKTKLGEWEYKGQRVRAGELFAFETVLYTIRGLIVSLVGPEPSAAAGQAER